MGSYSLWFHVQSYWSHISQSFCKLHGIFFVLFCQLTVLGHQQVLSAGRFKFKGPQPPKKKIQWFCYCTWQMATPSAYPWGFPCTYVSVDIHISESQETHDVQATFSLESKLIVWRTIPTLECLQKNWVTLAQWRMALKRDSKNFKSGIWWRIRQMFILFALVFNYFCGHWQYHSVVIWSMLSHLIIPYSTLESTLETYHNHTKII